MTEPFALGQPCWMDVTVKDIESRDGLMAFLKELFGWTFEVGGPESGGYTMASSDGDAVAALMADPEGVGQWTTYLNVDDINAAAERATAAGANIFMAPMQVMDAGSMALGMDPTGAVFGLWQKADFAGFGAADRPNAPCWFDHQSGTPNVASQFYTTVFGLSLDPAGDDGGGMLGVGEAQFASTSKSPDGVPPHWTTVIAVRSLAESEAKAVELGASVLMRDMAVPTGVMSAFSAPVTGTVICVFEATD